VGKVGVPPPVANAPAPRASLASGLAAAFVAVLFTIGGWQQMNMVAGRFAIRRERSSRARAGHRHRDRLLPRRNAVYLHTLGRAIAVRADVSVAADTATRLVGSAGATLITVAAMLSILGFVNVVILATPRIFFAMAKDGVFLQAAARVHPRFGSPYNSIVIMGVWAIALLLITQGRIGDLLSGVVFADWIFFGLGAASVFVLRRTRPDAPRPYRAWGYPIVPGFFVVAAVFGIVSAYVASLKTSLLGTAILGIGVLIFYGTQRRRPRSHEAQHLL
jgi:APA family basic amino acid/polyamine antiporter